MPLTDRQRGLYARHLLLAEIGEQGQERLCATRVTLSAAGDPEAARVAQEYLERAGVTVGRGGEPIEIPTTRRVARLAGGDAALHDAAAAVAGAHAAVEAIKHIVGVGRPGRLPEELELS